MRENMILLGPRADSLLGLPSRKWGLGADSCCWGRCLRQRESKCTGFSLPLPSRFLTVPSIGLTQQEPGKHPGGAGWEVELRTEDGSECKWAQDHHMSCEHYANGRTLWSSSKHQVNIPGPESPFHSSRGKHFLSMWWTNKLISKRKIKFRREKEFDKWISIIFNSSSLGYYDAL